MSQGFCESLYLLLRTSRVCSVKRSARDCEEGALSGHLCLTQAISKEVSSLQVRQWDGGKFHQQHNS